jgi:hypothetical protein
VRCFAKVVTGIVWLSSILIGQSGNSVAGGAETLVGVWGNEQIIAPKDS